MSNRTALILAIGSLEVIVRFGCPVYVRKGCDGGKVVLRKGSEVLENVESVCAPFQKRKEYRAIMRRENHRQP